MLRIKPIEVMKFASIGFIALKLGKSYLVILIAICNYIFHFIFILTKEMLLSKIGNKTASYNNINTNKNSN